MDLVPGNTQSPAPNTFQSTVRPAWGCTKVGRMPDFKVCIFHCAAHMCHRCTCANFFTNFPTFSSLLASQIKFTCPAIGQRKSPTFSPGIFRCIRIISRDLGWYWWRRPSNLEPASRGKNCHETQLGPASWRTVWLYNSLASITVRPILRSNWFVVHGACISMSSAFKQHPSEFRTRRIKATFIQPASPDVTTHRHAQVLAPTLANRARG